MEVSFIPAFAFFESRLSTKPTALCRSSSDDSVMAANLRAACPLLSQKGSYSPPGLYAHNPSGVTRNALPSPAPHRGPRRLGIPPCQRARGTSGAELRLGG